LSSFNEPLSQEEQAPQEEQDSGKNSFAKSIYFHRRYRYATLLTTEVQHKK